MPTEIRHLIFSSAEILEAVVQYYRQQGRSLLTGHLREAGPVDTPPGVPLIFRVAIAPNEPHGAELETVDLRGADLATALIGYCRHRGIPLPVKGSKVLERFGPQIGLIITIAGRNGALASN